MSWRDKIRTIDPYVPGEQPKLPDMIKLNTNESPYPPSPMVEQELSLLDPAEFRLYPDPQASELETALAAYYNVGSDQVFVGIGSDDVISQIYLTCFAQGGELLFPDITYSFYDVWAELYKVPYKRIPLTEDWHIDPADYKNAGGIIFPNPNAPTGIYEPLSLVEEIIKNNPDCVVVVDEAYIDFGGQSALSLLDKYENLIIVRTFSKSRSMAGIRIGFAIGSPEMISYIKAVKFSINSYTINCATIKLGVASIRDEEYFRSTTAKIINTRENAKKTLTELGFTFPDSMGNFIFAKHKTVSGKELFELLRTQKIFVRRFDHDRIRDHLRITIGTDEQMEKVFDFLRVYLG